MPAPSCVSIVDAYLTSLHEKFSVSAWDGGCSIETPYLLPDNSRLSVSVAFNAPDEVSVTDYGETFDRLFLTGVNLEPSDWRVMSSAERFGVGIDNGEISATVQPDQLSEAIHNVCHAILDISYLSYTRSPRAAPDFQRAVEDSIIRHDWRYEKNHKVLGSSSTNELDFIISQPRPVLVETITAQNSSRANTVARLSAFKVADTKGLPENQLFRFLCPLDDRDPDRARSVTEGARRPLEVYFDRVMPLSEFERIPTMAFAM